MIGILVGFILLVLFVITFIATLISFYEHAALNVVTSNDVKYMTIWLIAIVLAMASVIVYYMN